MSNRISWITRKHRVKGKPTWPWPGNGICMPPETQQALDNVAQVHHNVEHRENAQFFVG